jgi:hypothetical protein
MQIHHMSGRLGRKLFEDFLAVCFGCHRRIHDNPAWAKSQGFLK